MDTTLIKGLGMLEVLSASREARGVSDLAQELGLLKSNVHRVLQTLTRCGYVRKDAATGRYLSTLKTWKLGNQVADNLDIRTAARPHLRRLAEATAETVHLSVLEGVEALYIDKIDTPKPVASYSRIGGGGPAHCSATGKALIAYASPEVIERVSANLTRFTPRTITDPAKLRQEIKAIRKQGYASTAGQWHAGINGVAAPIFGGSENNAIAAVGISGLSTHLTLTRMRELAPLVKSTAADISKEVG